MIPRSYSDIIKTASNYTLTPTSVLLRCLAISIKHDARLKQECSRRPLERFSRYIGEMGGNAYFCRNGQPRFEGGKPGLWAAGRLIFAHKGPAPQLILCASNKTANPRIPGGLPEACYCLKHLVSDRPHTKFVL